MLKSPSLRTARAGLVCALTALIAAGCGNDDTKSKNASKEPPTTTTKTDTTDDADDAPEPAAPTEPAKPRTTDFTVTVRNGQPTGGPTIWRAKKGAKVRITVKSDTAEELHLHGYDVSTSVSAGGKATLELVADVTGSFELEFENAGTLIGNLQVR